MASATTTSIEEVKPDTFEPRTINFPADEQKAINEFLHKHITSRISRLKRIHTSLVPKWRRLANGEPLQKTRSTPFENASNLVYQLIGETVDDLAARVLQLVWMTSPIVYYRYFTDAVKLGEVEKYVKRAKTLMQFMDYVAYDPRELNLYPHENKWFIDGARLGRAWVIVAPESRIEAVYMGYNEKNSKALHFEKQNLYEGPKIINARYEDILYDPDVDVFEETDPLFRRCRLTLHKLRERVQKGTYLKAEVEKILGQPDHYGPSDDVKRENQRKGVTDTTDDTLAEWDVYESYFSWWRGNRKFRLIAWYHLSTKTCLNCVYNFIPDNQIPIVETTLTSDKRGFAEILEHAQDEISTAKNQRNDSINIGITGINTVDPQLAKNLGTNFRLMPNVSIPAKKDAFQHFDINNPMMASLSLENEQAMIMQAKERAGVGPAMAGMGAGTTNKKGAYSAMGTLAVMQDGNSRNDHRTSDFRHSHVRLLSLLTDFYGFLGLGRKAETFGLDDEVLKDALEDYLSRKLRIPIRAATASMNREVTKQNQIILNQAHAAYVKETSAYLQAYMNPSAGDENYKKWLLAIIKARTRMMQQIFKDFQVSDNPQEYVPDITVQEPKQNASPQAAANPSAISPMAESLQRQGEAGITPFGAGMETSDGGSPGGFGRSN